MKKIKVFLSVLVTLLVTTSVAYAVVQSLNGQAGQTQTFSNDTNITITSSSDVHTLGWQGTLSVSRGGTGTSSFTGGSILFGGSTILQDSSNLFWDDINKRLGVGTNSPQYTIEANGNIKAAQIISNTISSSGTNQSISLSPTGTGKVIVGGDSIVVASKSSEPGSPKTGQIYFDTTLNKFRGYNGTAWKNLTFEASTPAFDATSQANNTSGTTSLSFTHTTGSGASRALVVGLRFSNTTVSDVSVTYNGTAMTLAGTLSTGNDYGKIYYLLNPSTGSNNVSVNWTGTSRVAAGAISLTGIESVTGFNNAGNSGTSSPSVSISSNANSIVIDAMAWGYNTSRTFSASGQIIRVEIDSDTAGQEGLLMSTRAGASSVDMAYTPSGVINWEIGGLSLNGF